MILPEAAHGERPAVDTGTSLSYLGKARAPGQDDLVKDVQERLTEAWNHDRQNREDAIADLKFLAGDQWPEYAKQARQNRPMLTVNKLPQFLHQVTNTIRLAAPVIKVTPVDGKMDPAIAKIYDGIIADIQYRSNAKTVYASAAYHAAACGIGHFRLVTQYVDDESFDQEIRVELIPYPLAVYWDPAAVKPDRSDATWCIVIDLVPRSTFRAKYPGALEVSVNEMRGSAGSAGLFWATSDYVLVAEYWCTHKVKRKISAFDSGAVFDITDLQPHEMMQLIQSNGKPTAQRIADSARVSQSLVTGAEVLDAPKDWAGKFIPIVPVIGTEVPLERMVVRSGLIRHARDPQQLYNYYRSAAAEHIALSPKSPYMVTDTMIGKHKSDWDKISVRNAPYLRYTPDQTAPGQRPERMPAPEPPQALWQEAQTATDDIKATTGIYDASLGAKSNETSGIAIKQRTQQGDAANFHYQDNLHQAISHAGRILIDLIPKIYDNERSARLVAEDGSEQFVPINKVVYGDDGRPVMVNDLSVGRFDVRATIGPSYATKRLEAADAIVELMKSLPPELAPILADIAIKNMDIPEAEEAAKRLRAMLPHQALSNPDAPPPPPSDPLSDPVIRAKIEGDLALAKYNNAKANQLELMTVQQFQTPALPQSVPLPLEELENQGNRGTPAAQMPPPHHDLDALHAMHQAALDQQTNALNQPPPSSGAAGPAP